MTKEIIKLWKVADSGYYGKTPKDTLESVLKDIEANEETWSTAKKAIVIFLDDTENDNYNIVWNQCNLRLTEIITLLEYCKYHAIDRMSDF